MSKGASQESVLIDGEVEEAVTPESTSTKKLATQSPSSASNHSSHSLTLEGTFQSSFTALSNTRAHTRTSAQRAEDTMAQKLRAKGKAIAAPPAATVQQQEEAKCDVDGDTNTDENAKKSRRGVRFAEGEDEEEKKDNGSTLNDFDAYLKANFQYSSTSSSSTATQSTARLSDNNSYTETTNLPSSISIDPTSLCSFLHHASPLRTLRIPSLQQLCVSALSTLAMKYELDESALGILPSLVLEQCVEALKRPSCVGAYAATGSSQDQLDSDPSSPSNSKHSLRDTHLLPFLHTHLLTLDLESHDTISGGIVGLADIWLGDVTSDLLTSIVTKCHSLTSLNLTSYPHSFTLSQIDALSHLDFHDLTLTHCLLKDTEFELLMRSFRSLKKLGIGWTNFLTSSSGNTGYSTLLSVLSQPHIRSTLTSLHIDGLRASPNELLWKMLTLLPRLSHLNIDSVSPPQKSVTREEEEEEKRRVREMREMPLSTTSAAADTGEDEEEIQTISQLTSDNLRLREIVEQQKNASAATDSLSSPSSSSTTSAMHFPSFTSLSAIASDKLTSETLLLLLPHTPNLSSLILKGCHLINGDVIISAAQYCRFLQHLNIADCHGVEEQALLALRDATLPVSRRTMFFGTQPQIQALAENQVDAPASSAASSQPPLPSPSSSSSSFLPPIGSYLHSLDLSWCENISNTTLSALLDMSYSSSSEIDLSLLSSPPNLLVTPHYSLSRVVLSCLEEIDETTIAKLAKHTQLQELDISRCVYTSAKAIFRTSEQAALSTNAVDPSYLVSSSSLSSHSPSSWSNLLRLNLGWTTVDNSDLGRVVVQCPLLQSLNVEGCKHLDDACITLLISSPVTMMNLSSVSFYFVNRVQLKGIVHLLQRSRCYWLSVKDYYGDSHDVTTLEKDLRDIPTSIE